MFDTERTAEILFYITLGIAIYVWAYTMA